MIAKGFPLFLALLALPSVSCNIVEPPEIPKGTSKFSAMIDGIPTSFPVVTSFWDDNGFKVIATNAPKDTINFNLGKGGGKGHYAWTGHKDESIWFDTVGFYNGKPAISGIGGLTITRSDSTLQRIVGTFAFAVADTARLDTISVTNGAFDIYWTK